jgi:tricarballylate dehydrogenase
VFTVPTAHYDSGVTSRYMYPYSIMVNIDGKRFVDEASDTRGKTYAKTGRAILTQPGGVAFQILDAKARKMNLYPNSYKNATSARADTLEKLAKELGVNASNLATTVKEFNAAIQPGAFNPDRQRLDGKHTLGIAPPKSNYSLSVEEPPFEGFAVRCGMTFTYGGLRIDPKSGQVQHVAGRPIKGLYAAGEIMGGLWVGNYPSGSGMMAGATFGRLAGTHAGITATQS